jgi:hypothetical protein
MVFIPFNNSNLIEDLFQLQVFDALGNLMFQKNISKIEQGVNIETADWPQGTYFYRLIGAQGSSETLKMQIQR